MCHSFCRVQWRESLGGRSTSPSRHSFLERLLKFKNKNVILCSTILVIVFRHGPGLRRWFPHPSVPPDDLFDVRDYRQLPSDPQVVPRFSTPTRSQTLLRLQTPPCSFRPRLGWDEVLSKFLTTSSRVGSVHMVRPPFLLSRPTGTLSNLRSLRREENLTIFGSYTRTPRVRDILTG